METDIVQLLLEYLSGEMSENHRLELMNWMEEKEENRLFVEKVSADASFCRRWKQREGIDVESAVNRFEARTGKKLRKRAKHYWKYAAAVILLLGIMGVWTLRHGTEGKRPVEVVDAERKPGDERAVLILANGQQLPLISRDSVYTDLGQEGCLEQKNHQLIYGQNTTMAVLQYNTLMVPRGSEYQVVLSDGSIVRLNAASSLKYPIAFGGNKREVELSGEAYFKVKSDTVPFIVKIGDMTVKVYGTAFNVNGYRPDLIRTALLEGKVGITLKGNEKEFILQPSQLAEVNLRTHQIGIRQTDLSPYLAWTKGLFIFNNTSLEEIMNSLALWYDLAVFYRAPEVKNLHFTGVVKRYDKIDVILKALSQSVGVKFSQQGKTLLVGK